MHSQIGTSYRSQSVHVIGVILVIRWFTINPRWDDEVLWINQTVFACCIQTQQMLLIRRRLITRIFLKFLVSELGNCQLVGSIKIHLVNAVYYTAIMGAHITSISWTTCTTARRFNSAVRVRQCTNEKLLQKYTANDLFVPPLWLIIKYYIC